MCGSEKSIVFNSIHTHTREIPRKFKRLGWSCHLVAGSVKEKQDRREIEREADPAKAGCKNRQGKKHAKKHRHFPVTLAPRLGFHTRNLVMQVALQDPRGHVSRDAKARLAGLGQM